ncbi:MAG: FAD-dependent oxidoreductase [Proteobacteria bacterium]|nr:FAD-dependent oxidoreductase [Pseudomonadota bacterium]
MKEQRCIIVGASHAGATLALQLRREGWSGAIQLIGAEAELPYHRPPLSKEHLAGAKTIDCMRLRPAKVYQDNAIELLLGTAVEHIDIDAKSVKLSDKRELRFDKLALCTGAEVRKLPIGEGLANIFYLRTAADVAPLISLSKTAKRVVIIGAGYIGLETAAVLIQKGLQVTVLEMADRILNRVTSEAMSDFMAALHRDHGVAIVTATEVTEIRGGDVVEQVICADGTEFDADFVIIGVGVTPNTQLAASAGLEVGEGVLVNEYTQTSAADVYAAGDCTSHPSGLYKRVLRLESVQNANEQARAAAANICGRQTIYDAVPWFWSDQYHIKLQMAGINSDYDRVVIRGDPSLDNEAGFALFYFKDAVLIAADCVGRPKEFMVSKQMVKNRLKLDPSILEDESIDPVNFIA